MVTLWPAAAGAGVGVGAGAGAGAGLGLAIVTRYAELMHARFELVDGPLGVGLCARVLFAQPVLA